MYSRINYHLIMPILERRQRIVTRPHYAHLLANQGWSRDHVHQFQLGKLKELVAHAYRNTSFYRKRLAAAGIEPDSVKTLDDFKLIPPLTREDLNSQLEAMIATNISPQEMHRDATGGSTGLSTQFARDNKCLGIKRASEFRLNSWTGWRPGEKILYYWPALRDFAGNYRQPSIIKQKIFSREVRLYAGRLNDGILAEHLKAFLQFRPHLIRAFPNSLQIFAEYALAKRVSFGVQRGVICVGEPLTEHQRELFKKVFNSDVYNCYVSRECGNTACECEAHQGMHVAEDLYYLEVESDRQGRVGRILITDLYNLGMPLIRYDIQDASRFINGDCACGRSFRRIDLDAARLTDYLISPVDGSLISGSTVVHYLLAEGPRVGRFQLIQDGQRHILIRMSGDYESNEKGIVHIKKVLNKVFKGEMRLDIEFVDSIPFLPSGKYRFVQRTFAP